MKKYLSLLSLFLSFSFAKAQTGDFIQPNFGSSDSYKSSFFSGYYVRPYLEVLTLNSITLGGGAILRKNAKHYVNLGADYDILKRAYVGRVGFHFGFLAHIGLEYANLNDLKTSYSYMPVFLGIGNPKKLVISYVHNFFLPENNTFNYPLDQICLRYSLGNKYKKSRAAEDDYYAPSAL